jgi:hypothetical protein
MSRLGLVPFAQLDATDRRHFEAAFAHLEDVKLGAPLKPDRPTDEIRIPTRRLELLFHSLRMAYCPARGVNPTIDLLLLATPTSDSRAPPPRRLTEVDFARCVEIYDALVTARGGIFAAAELLFMSLDEDRDGVVSVEALRYALCDARMPDDEADDDQTRHAAARRGDSTQTRHAKAPAVPTAGSDDGRLTSAEFHHALYRAGLISGLHPAFVSDAVVDAAALDRAGLIAVPDEDGAVYELPTGTGMCVPGGVTYYQFMHLMLALQE